MPLKEAFITYISREEGARHATQGHMEKHQVRSGAEGAGAGVLGHLLRWGFCGQDEVGQRKQPRTD